MVISILIYESLLMVITVDGWTVCSSLVGTPYFSHNDKKLFKSWPHLLELVGPTNRKSSMICDMPVTPYLCSMIHCSALEKTFEDMAWAAGPHGQTFVEVEKIIPSKA